MDNKALEKYNAEHKTNTNHAPPEPKEFDPFDDHISTTEVAVMAVLGIVLVFAILQIIFKPKSKQQSGE